MGCTSNTVRRTQTIWTKRSTTSVFVPLFEGSALKYTRFKLDYELDEAEGTVEVSRAIRYSNDRGKTWGSAVAIGSYSSATGWNHHDTFEAIDDDFMDFQVGYLVRNDSGSDQRMGRLDSVLALATAARQ